MIELRIWIGSAHEPPGRPAKLLPCSTEFEDKMADRRLLMIFTKHFRAVSNKVMGRVFFNRASHSYGFRIGYTVASRQPLGISLLMKQSFISESRWVCAVSP